MQSSPGYGWTGWSVLIDSLRRAYGPIVGRMKVSALHRNLAQYVCRAPALVDGHMKPADWLQTQDSFQKVDYEHHTFGRTNELYIVDPAYDLASAVFEFRLSTEDENELIARYVQLSGDSEVAGRILLWKLVHGVVVMELATAALDVEKRAARFADVLARTLHSGSQFPGSSNEPIFFGVVASQPYPHAMDSAAHLSRSRRESSIPMFLASLKRRPAV